MYVSRSNHLRDGKGSKPWEAHVTVSKQMLRRATPLSHTQLSAIPFVLLFTSFGCPGPLSGAALRSGNTATGVQLGSCFTSACLECAYLHKPQNFSLQPHLNVSAFKEKIVREMLPSVP